MDRYPTYRNQVVTPLFTKKRNTGRRWYDESLPDLELTLNAFSLLPIAIQKDILEEAFKELKQCRQLNYSQEQVRSIGSDNALALFQQAGQKRRVFDQDMFKRKLISRLMMVPLRKASLFVEQLKEEVVKAHQAEATKALSSGNNAIVSPQKAVILPECKFHAKPHFEILDC